ncbi:MAG: pyridoxamine 5'-phosphate oxidase family protein [bacterium]
MFREVVRKKQALSREECIEILKNELRGVLAVNGDDGYPYALPINHFYNDEDGCLYFHSGRTGHKLDALRRDGRASFCCYDGGFIKPGDWALNIKSVIVFGKVSIVEDHAVALDISRRLSRKFTADERYIEDEVAHSGPAVLVFKLIPEHMTGKLVNEK